MLLWMNEIEAWKSTVTSKTACINLYETRLVSPVLIIWRWERTNKWNWIELVTSIHQPSSSCHVWCSECHWCTVTAIVSNRWKCSLWNKSVLSTSATPWHMLYRPLHASDLVHISCSSFTLWSQSLYLLTTVSLDNAWQQVYWCRVPKTNYNLRKCVCCTAMPDS